MGVAGGLFKDSTYRGVLSSNASLEVGLGNVLDGVGPGRLRLSHILLADAVGRSRRSRGERHRRMVQENAHLAVGVLLVTKGVLHFGLASIRAAGEIVISHGNGRIAGHLDLVVVEHNVRPTLAAVDREAGVLLVAVLHRSVPDKVGHGVGGGWPELGFSCLQGEFRARGFKPRKVFRWEAKLEEHLRGKLLMC